MAATKQQLEERWGTPDGEKRLEHILSKIKDREMKWEEILKGFPYADEVNRCRDLRYAPLAGKDIPGAHMWHVNLTGANLRGANLAGASLNNATFDNTDIRGAIFDNVDLGGHIVSMMGGGTEAQGRVNFLGVQFDRKTTFLRTDLTRNNWSSNPLLKRHVEDLQWLDCWCRQNWWHLYVLHPLWWLSCDCGRSVLRWAVWSLLWSVGFGLVYLNCGESFLLTDGKTLAEAHWFMPFYYSVVTFTTLGFGDVTPKPDSAFMQAVITIEVVMGYVMLGGLVSILAAKLARRA